MNTLETISSQLYSNTVTSLLQFLFGLKDVVPKTTVLCAEPSHNAVPHSLTAYFVVQAFVYT